jgi:hypothetical protein
MPFFGVLIVRIVLLGYASMSSADPTDIGLATHAQVILV